MKNSNTQLKTAVRNQVKEEQLSQSELQQLLSMQEAVLKTPRKKTNITKLSLAGAFAGLLFTLAITWQWGYGQPGDATEQIAREVVENHLKLKPLDVQTSSIATIQRFFTQLDFSPKQSGYLANQFSIGSESLLGGRYCSIKGNTAAQLRYQQSANELSTLYEVPYAQEQFGHMPNIERGELPKVVFEKGLQVSMWQEKGLLMVLVKEP